MTKNSDHYHFEKNEHGSFFQLIWITGKKRKGNTQRKEKKKKCFEKKLCMHRFKNIKRVWSLISDYYVYRKERAQKYREKGEGMGENDIDCMK